MGGDESKRRGTTKRFTREELAELADKARGDKPAPASEEAVVAVQPEVTPMSRSMTLHDPMTTQLLAEVARRLQTMELEVPEGVENAGDFAEDDETVETAHPHLRRRRSP